MPKLAPIRSKQTFVVRTKPTLPTPLLWAIAIGILIAIAIASFFAGLHQSGYLVQANAAFERQLRERNTQLETQLGDAQQQAASAEQSLQIEAVARAETKQLLTQAQAEIAALQEDLGFYRLFSDIDKVSDKLQLHDVSVSDEGEGRYVVTALLAYRNSERVEVPGTLDMRLSGEISGRSVIYAMSDLHPDKAPSIPFSLMRYQRIDWALQLRTGMKPETLTVIVNPQSDELTRVSKDFTWQSLISS